MNRAGPDTNAEPSPEGLDSESRWAEVRRSLQLSKRYPRGNFALVVLCLAAAGWLLQERAFGNAVACGPQPFFRVLLAAIPLVLTTVLVLVMRRR